MGRLTDFTGLAANCLPVAFHTDGQDTAGGNAAGEAPERSFSTPLSARGYPDRRVPPGSYTKDTYIVRLLENKTRTKTLQSELLFRNPECPTGAAVSSGFAQASRLYLQP